MKLENKVAVITGAGSGMGRAMAILFASEGAKVVAADINQANLESVVAEIKSKGGEAISVLVNIVNKGDVEEMIQAAIDTYGKLDILVNNAGIMDNVEPVGDLLDEQWERVINVNLRGPFMASRAAVNVMKENGGVIVNNASVGGLFGARGGAAYVMSKHGLIGLTKNIASTYGREGGNIRANAIATGAVKTNIGSTMTAPNQLGLQAMGDTGPQKRAEPMEVAKVALFLASDDSSFVNGAVVTADGGWTAR